MKFLALLFLCASASAADVTLIWNANPASDGVTEYRVYERIGATRTKIATVATPTAKVIVADKLAHVYDVTAANATAESLPSDPVTLMAGVTGLKITITIP